MAEKIDSKNLGLLWRLAQQVWMKVERSWGEWLGCTRVWRGEERKAKSQGRGLLAKARVDQVLINLHNWKEVKDRRDF